MSGFSELPPNVHTAKHPLIAHKITRLRNRDTKQAEFRSLLREISFYLGYEVGLRLCGVFYLPHLLSMQNILVFYVFFMSLGGHYVCVLFQKS